MQKYNLQLTPSGPESFRSDKPGSKPIAVLMSGGVDSSLCAHILKEAGWNVMGLTMKIPVSCNEHLKSRGADAAVLRLHSGKAVCKQLNLPHYFVDVTTAFTELIIEPFRQSYRQGLTPNPCAGCNAKLKFGLLWDFLQEKLGINHIATGHYARVVKTNGRTYLARAADKSKDQSYFLYGISPGRIEKLVFPLGDFTKQQVRSMAASLNLPVAERPESMELCFTAEGDYRGLFEDAELNRHGQIQDMQGRTIGTHKGITNYTIGQRRGVGFAGGQPLYVAGLNANTNTITLGKREEVSHSIIQADQINVLIPELLRPGQSLSGKVRSYGQVHPCEVIEFSEENLTVRFDQPVFAPCPGQKLVLYDRQENIAAGGTIVSFSQGVLTDGEC
jgi:tRNA-specific 2-thiouridylase